MKTYRGTEAQKLIMVEQGLYKEIERALIMYKNGEKGEPETKIEMKDAGLIVRVCKLTEEESIYGKKDADNELRLQIIKSIKKLSEDAFLIQAKKEFKERRQGRTR